MFVMNYAFDELYVSMGQKFEIFIMLQKCESSTVITHEFALFSVRSQRTSRVVNQKQGILSNLESLRMLKMNLSRMCLTNRMSFYLMNP